MRQQQHPRQKNRAKWIDVLQRVKAHPTKSRGRIVAAGPGNKRMGRLMESDGDDGRQQPDRNGVDHLSDRNSLVLASSCGRGDWIGTFLAAKPMRRSRFQYPLTKADSQLPVDGVSLNWSREIAT